jgi:hypothetical protein
MTLLYGFIADCNTDFTSVLNTLCVNVGYLQVMLWKTEDSAPNACYHSVQNLLSFRLLSTNTKIRVYRTVILPIVLYACETWSLILREEQRLRVFENRVLSWIFGPKRDEATGEWRRLNDEEFNHLYSSPNTIRVIKSRRMR